MNVVVVPGQWHHAFVLAQNMRTKDVRELAACGQTPLGGVLFAMSQGRSYAALYDDVVGAMFGVRDLGGGRGEFWVLTTGLFEEKPIAFVKAAKAVVKKLLGDFNELINCIDARYGEAIRLAERLGATFGPTIRVGPQKMPFTPFSIRRGE